MNGFRIELGEVESALASYPDVEHAVVVVRDGQLAAYVTAAHGAVLDAEAISRLRAFIGRTLTSYMMPRLVMSASASACVCVCVSIFHIPCLTHE